MNARSHTIIPDSENHCVWMDAGLVDYKLCNSAFECDSCPFDTVMRDQHQTFAEQAAMQSGSLFSNVRFHESGHEGINQDSMDIFLKQLSSTAVPEDRIYFSNHTWMQSAEKGMFRVGIDGFLARLISPVSGIATIHAPSHTGRGEPYAWVIRGSAMFAVQSNEKGIVSAINARLMDRPSLITSDPYGEGWLTTLSCSRTSPAERKFYTADEFKEFLGRETDSLLGEMKKYKRSASATMFDGGKLVESIEKFIGEKRYTKIISGLMSPH